MSIQMRKWFGISFVLIGLMAAACGAEPVLGSPGYKPAPDHPIGWRGDGTGRFVGATPAIEWGEKKNVRWSVPVGSSFSSPIFTDKFVFVTAEPNFLLCIDRSNGKIVWKIETKPSDLPDEKSRKAAAEYEPPKDGAGMSAATPVTDGQSVFIVLANGIVRALDFDGKQKWIAYIEADQITGYGRSASPILAGGKLVVSLTNLYAFDPANGKQLWVNTDAPSTYGTPVGAKLHGVDAVAIPDGEVVRLSDGKTLATDVGKGSHTSPLIMDNVVYYGENTPNASRVNAAFKAEELWSGTIMGDVFSSPLWANDLIFTASGKGGLYVYDAKGKGDQAPVIEARPLWVEGDSNAPVTYSSITLAGKYLFLNSLQGEMVVFEATREAKIVARNRLPAGSGSSPAFSGKDMLIRAGNTLFCIGE